MTKKKVIFLVILIVVLIIFSYFSKPEVSTIVNGVITSIIASFLFFIFTMLTDSSSDEIKNEIINIGKKISSISEYVDTDDNSLKNRFGIIKIEHRKEYSYDFWVTLLEEALETRTSQFIISGKTLHRWLEPNIKENFVKTLRELITRKTEIIFVIYSEPTNKKKREDLQKVLDKNVFPHLIDVCGIDVKEINKVFSIYEVDSLPYLYTAIDNQMIVAQYFNYTSNAENIMLVLSPECEFARRYYTDFHEMIQGHINNKWILDFLQKQEEK